MANGQTVIGVQLRVVETQHVEGVLHLATDFAETNLTLCKRRVAKRTMIPVEAFANERGASWCKQCCVFCADYGLEAGRVNLTKPTDSPVAGYRQYRKTSQEES